MTCLTRQDATRVLSQPEHGKKRRRRGKDEWKASIEMNIVLWIVWRRHSRFSFDSVLP